MTIEKTEPMHSSLVMLQPRHRARLNEPCALRGAGVPLALLIAAGLALSACASPQVDVNSGSRPPDTAPAPPPRPSPPPPPASAPAPAPVPVSPPPPPAPAAQKVTFVADAFFAVSQTELRPEARAKLDDLVQGVSATNLEVIIVVGHADTAEAGGTDAAMRLSLRRAEAVKAYLVARGVESNRVYTEGKGSRQPVADNKTAEGRAKNRRAEVEAVGTRTGKGTTTPAGRTIAVLFATNRAKTGESNPVRFFGESEAAGSESQRLTMGRAVISVPPLHHRGELEEPGLVRVTVAKITRSEIARVLRIAPVEAIDPERHFAFAMPLELLDASGFANALRQSMGAAKRGEALLYVHGFANSFADAAFRTAQFAYDLTDAKIDMAPLMFSWPSDPSAVNYAGAADRTWSAGRQLARFLEQVVDNAGLGVVHIVAHSKGAQVLGVALEHLRAANLMALNKEGKLAPKFNQIVLAAPDIRAADFEGMILPALASGHRVTNYVASNDEALKLSKKMNAGQRAGDSGSGAVLVKGVRTIDVSAVNAGLLGHSGFAEAKRVLGDIAKQLTGVSPAERKLISVPTKELEYWIIR